MNLFILLFFIWIVTPDQGIFYPYNLYFFHTFYFYCLLKSILGVFLLKNKNANEFKLFLLTFRRCFFKFLLLMLPSIFVSLLFLFFVIYILTNVGLKNTKIFNLNSFLNNMHLNIYFIALETIGLLAWIFYLILEKKKTTKGLIFISSIFTPLTFLLIFLGRMLQFMN
jgi:hypothetical protein